MAAEPLQTTVWQRALWSALMRFGELTAVLARSAFAASEFHGPAGAQHCLDGGAIRAVSNPGQGKI